MHAVGQDVCHTPPLPEYTNEHVSREGTHEFKPNWCPDEGSLLYTVNRDPTGRFVVVGDGQSADMVVKDVGDEHVPLVATARRLSEVSDPVFIELVPSVNVPLVTRPLTDTALACVRDPRIREEVPSVMTEAIT